MAQEYKQEEFNEFVIENDVIGIFEEAITLKSGRVSNWYVNWRTVSEDVYLMDKLTDFVIAYVEHKGLDVDCFFGVPEGASKLGIITQFKWALRHDDYAAGMYTLPMGRAKPKEHGAAKDRYFVGKPKGKTILLEDTTTTGGSLLTTLDQLLAADVSVLAAIGLTNRNELRNDKKSVATAIAEKGVPYYAMSNALELLPALYRRAQKSTESAEMLTEYFARYGEQELILNN